jgi:hypothetical protein
VSKPSESSVILQGKGRRIKRKRDRRPNPGTSGLRQEFYRYCAPGFQAGQVLAGQLSLSYKKYPDPGVQLALIERLVGALQNQPGMGFTPSILLVAPSHGANGWIPPTGPSVNRISGRCSVHLDNVTVRIADVATNLAVLGYWLCDELPINAGHNRRRIATPSHSSVSFREPCVNQRQYAASVAFHRLPRPSEKSALPAPRRTARARVQTEKTLACCGDRAPIVAGTAGRIASSGRGGLTHGNPLKQLINREGVGPPR